MFREPRGSVLGNPQLSQEEIAELFGHCQYGTLAVNGEHGYPIAVPVNVAYHEGAVYFHTAQRGEKMDCIRRDPRVCLNVYEEASDIGQQPISAHRSVTIYGQAQILTGAEMVETLRYIAVAAGMPFKATDEYIMPRMKGIVAVRIRPEHMTGRVVKFGGMNREKNRRQ